VRTHTQRLLYNLSTFGTFLAGETRVHSDDLMAGSFSLVRKYSEKGAPRGIHDGLRKVMVLDHVGDVKGFYGDMLVSFSVGFSRLKMMVSSLAVHLQMGLRRATGCFLTAVASLLAPTEDALLAAECAPRRAIEAWVLHCIPFAIAQEGRETHINTDVRMRTRDQQMVRLWECFTDDQRIAVGISTQDQMDRLRSSFKGTVQFDFHRLAQFLGNHQVLLVFMEVHIFAVLPQLDRVPTVGRLEAREPTIRNTMLFRSKEAAEGLTQAVCQHLYGRSWHMLTLPLESCFKVILTRERLALRVVCFDCLQHLIIDDARLDQALRQQMLLFPIRI